MKFYLISLFFTFFIGIQGDVPTLDGRIIGGQLVDISSFPYQVSVRLYDQHICGGSIINKSTILTAAHCVYGMDHSQYSVRLGNNVHDLGTSHVVYRVIPHRSYSPRTFDNDMAILKLATPISYTAYAAPVPLQPLREEVPAGTKSWVSGWGVTYEGGQSVLSNLRATDVAVITKSDCIRQYGQVITRHMLCAQTIGKDSCQGDSGGPLVANGKLIGVVSWGYGCARPQFPGVYSKVSNMYQWIVANS